YDDIAENRKDPAAQSWCRPVDIAVRGDDHVVRAEHTARRRDLPGIPVALHRTDTCLRAQAHALRYGPVEKPLIEERRIDRCRASDRHPAVVEIRTDLFALAFARDHLRSQPRVLVQE